MKAIRKVLAFPLLVLQWVFGGLMMLMPWVARRLSQASRGVHEHLYWPMVIGRRMIDGRPRWQPYDLQVGKQPRTDADRARAEASPDVVRVQCFCGKPDCEAATTQMYAWAPGGAEAIMVKAATMPQSIDDFLQRGMQDANTIRELTESLAKTTDSLERSNDARLGDSERVARSITMVKDAQIAAAQWKARALAAEDKLAQLRSTYAPPSTN